MQAVTQLPDLGALTRVGAEPLPEARACRGPWNLTPGGHGPGRRCFLQAPHMPRRFKSLALWLQPPAAFLWMINALTQSPGGFLCLFSLYNQVGGESGQVPRRFWTPDLPNQFLLWNSHWLQPSNFLCPALTRVTAERTAGEQVPTKLGPQSSLGVGGD